MVLVSLNNQFQIEQIRLLRLQTTVYNIQQFMVCNLLLPTEDC